MLVMPRAFTGGAFFIVALLKKFCYYISVCQVVEFRQPRKAGQKETSFLAINNLNKKQIVSF